MNTTSSESHGKTREAQVRQIAGRLGVADFVYTAPPVPKGSAQREASGDGLLMIGMTGAVLQVKSRDPAISDSEERAVAWIRKTTRKAMKQGLGTKRELARRQALGTPVVVSPTRAAHLPPDVRRRYESPVSSDTESWPVFVIVDHPKCPVVDLGFVPGVLWFTIDDWLELQRRLRSTSALLTYAQRIFNARQHIPLGREVERYEAMWAADERAATRSAKKMPYLSHASEFDPLGSDLFHDVIDKVWPDDGLIPWRSAEEYRAIVEFLDSVPPQLQSHVGRWFLRKRAEITRDKHTSSGLVQVSDDRLVYACSRFSYWDNIENWFAEFTLLTSLRHTQALETGASDSTTTLGVGALVEDRAGQTGVQYTFVLLRSREVTPPIPDDLRHNMEWVYGIHNHREGTTKEAKVGRNQPCPCMSGKKFKQCCGRNT